VHERTGVSAVIRAFSGPRRVVDEGLNGRGEQLGELVRSEWFQAGSLDAMSQETESGDERCDGLDVTAPGWR
jgi:hypothetical protein